MGLGSGAASVTVRMATSPGTGVTVYSPSASTSSAIHGRSRWSAVALAGVYRQGKSSS